MGAIASGGVRVLNDDVVSRGGIGPEVLEAVTAGEQRELERREREYRGSRPAVAIAGRHVLAIDDGLATGASMRAAVAALRAAGAASITVAAPVAAAATCAQLAREADAVVCARTPDPFLAVGVWYRDFASVGDEEVRRLLARSPPGEGPWLAPGR